MVAASKISLIKLFLYELETNSVGQNEWIGKNIILIQLFTNYIELKASDFHWYYLLIFMNRN